MKDIMKGIFFDLDGTLINTAEDLIKAIQHALNGYKDIDRAQLYPRVSQGFRSLLEFFVGEVEQAEYKVIHDRFINHYQTNVCKHSNFYPSLRQLLLELQENQIPHGIITNKSHPLASQLMAEILPQWQGILLGW